MISEMPRRVPATSPGLRKSAIRDLLLGARDAILDGDLLRFHRQIGHAQAIVQEWIVLHVEVQLGFVFHGVADCHQPVGQPIAQAIALQHRHHDVDIGLELDQTLARIGDRAVANADELHAILLLECLGQRDEILRVHLHARRDGWDSRPPDRTVRKFFRATTQGQ